MTRKTLICFLLYIALTKALQFSFILVNFLTIELRSVSLYCCSDVILSKSDDRFLSTCVIGQVSHLANSPNSDRQLISPHMAAQTEFN